MGLPWTKPGFLAYLGALVFLPALLGGCGIPGSPPAGEVRVEITPAEVALRPGERVTFTARVLNAQDTGVEWSATGGSLEVRGNTATFTMPVVYGEQRPFTVTAKSRQDPSKSASATVSWKGAPGQVVVEPSAVFFEAPGETVQLTARVIGPDGREIPNARVEWQVSNPSAFSVGPDGVLRTTGRLGDSTLVMARYQDFVPGFATAAVGKLREGVKRLKGQDVPNFRLPSQPLEELFSQPFAVEVRAQAARGLRPGDRLLVEGEEGWVTLRVERVEEGGPLYRVWAVLLPLGEVFERLTVEVNPQGLFQQEMLRAQSGLMQREMEASRLRPLGSGDPPCEEMDREPGDREPVSQPRVPYLEFSVNFVPIARVHIDLFGDDEITFALKGRMALKRGSYLFKRDIIRRTRDGSVFLSVKCEAKVPILLPTGLNYGLFSGGIEPKMNFGAEATFRLTFQESVQLGVYLGYLEEDWVFFDQALGFSLREVQGEWRLEPARGSESSPGPPRFVPLKIDFQAGANVAFSAEASLFPGIVFSLSGKLLGSGLELDIAELRAPEFRVAYRHNNLFTFPDKYSNPNYSGTDFSARISYLLTLRPLLEGIESLRKILRTSVGIVVDIRVPFNPDLIQVDFFRLSMRGAPADGVGVYLGEASATPSVSPEPLRVRPGQEVALKVWVRPRIAEPPGNELRGLLGLGQTYEVYILGDGQRSPQKLGEAYVGAGGEATLRVRVPENLPPGNYLLRAFNIPSVPFFDYASNLLGLEVSWFDLTLFPASLTLQPGQSGTTTLTITPQGGFTGTVNLSLVDGSGNPVPDITLSPTSVSVTGPSPVTQDLTLSVDSGVALGTYNLQVRATSGSLTKTANLSLTVSAPGGDGAGTTWTLRNQKNPLYAVTYGNGLFVAVGWGIIFTSPDWGSWTERASETGNGLRGVTYGNGLFVAVGKGGAVLTSPDGVTWTARTSGTGNWLYAVTYGNGTFVAVGEGGAVLTSPDGVTWTRRTSGTGNDLNGVTYGNGLFVAVGEGGAVLTSPDGVTWTRRTSGTGNDLYAVTYGNDLFVAVGRYGAILTSADGVSWTQQTSPMSSWLRGVTYGDGLFVAVGLGGAMLTSSDGVTWTARNSGTGNDLYAVTYGNGTFVAVGDPTIVGISTSNWEIRNSFFWFRDPLYGVTYGNGTFVVVGGWGTILTSPDGVTWTRRTSGTGNDLYGVTYGNDLFVAVGWNGAILTSADGVNWTARTSGTGNDLYGVTYGNGTFVAVGDGGAVLTSRDGVTWTAWTPRTGNPLRGVTYRNGTFVAVGDGGAVLTSRDGVNWTARTSGTGNTLYGVTYGNGTFVAVGDGGAVLTSRDGVTWTRRTSGTGNTLRGVTYGNGPFVAVGWNSTILTSSDGVNWTRQTSPTSNPLEGVTYGNGTFVAVGPYGTILTSP
jgi:hypothetical protein